MVEGVSDHARQIVPVGDAPQTLSNGRHLTRWKQFVATRAGEGTPPQPGAVQPRGPQPGAPPAGYPPPAPSYPQPPNYTTPPPAPSGGGAPSGGPAGWGSPDG